MTNDEVETRLTALEQQLANEKAERVALQTLVLPPLTQVRQDLQLNVDFLTERLESLKAARPASGADADVAVIYEGLIALLKFLNATDARLDWLVQAFTRSEERQLDQQQKLLEVLGQAAAR